MAKSLPGTCGNVNGATWWNSSIRPLRAERRHQDLWQRYLAIIFDGLRPEGAHPLPQPPPG